MVDVVIIGAGVIGCSIARELSKYEVDIVVLEKHADVACGTSKANSGIVHAGHDALPGTKKAFFNRLGQSMFEEISQELSFPFKRNGSMIVAFDETEMKGLIHLKKQGEKNGLNDLEILDAKEISLIEPNISEKVYAALLSPSGGITCPYQMTIAYAENAAQNDVIFHLNNEVYHIEKAEGSYKIYYGDHETMNTKLVINAAGLYSDQINNFLPGKNIHIIARKGEYCLLDKQNPLPVSRTIFQMPTPMGKGVLVTPTIDGNLLLGPTSYDIWDKEDFGTTKKGMEEVMEKASKSVKKIDFRQIITSFSGLRAHLYSDDFIIEERKDYPNFFNVAGIESPGLSASPAIAQHVASWVCNKLSPKKKTDFCKERKTITNFRDMNWEEKEQLIQKDCDFGKIICRCETVSKAEIKQAMHAPIKAGSLDAIKRRTRAGMGRCQGGFCSMRIVDLLAEENHLSMNEVCKCDKKSNLLSCPNKEEVSS